KWTFIRRLGAAVVLSVSLLDLGLVYFAGYQGFVPESRPDLGWTAFVAQHPTATFAVSSFIPPSLFMNYPSLKGTLLLPVSPEVASTVASSLDARQGFPKYASAPEDGALARTDYWIYEPTEWLVNFDSRAPDCSYDDPLLRLGLLVTAG